MITTAVMISLAATPRAGGVNQRLRNPPRPPTLR